MIKKQSFFATCPRGLSDLLALELSQLGMKELKNSGSGVMFSADLNGMYRVILYSRVANNVLLPLVEGEITDDGALYDLVQSVDWSSCFPGTVRFKVDFIGTNHFIRHTKFGAQRIKDAVVDQFQERKLSRPTIDLTHPQIILHAYLNKGRLNLSLNVSGKSMHRRGYREDSVTAPLKENLAAAILMRAGWPEQYMPTAGFFDPMCGSGTLLIEAAMMSLNIPPGLLRAEGQGVGQTSDGFGFNAWLEHDAKAWEDIVEGARRHRDEIIEKTLSQTEGKPLFVGCDISHKAIKAAKANIKAAGLQGLIMVTGSDMNDFSPRLILAGGGHAPVVDHEIEGGDENHSNNQALGLVITNPPYGDRLGQEEVLTDLYQSLGQKFKEGFSGWQGGVFTGNEALAGAMRLRARKKYRFLNGAIPSQLWLFDLVNDGQLKLREELQGVVSSDQLSEAGSMVLNRLKKNAKRLKRWKERSGISCYRLYDADIPEFACAVDVYGSQVHVQEYAAPKQIPKGLAAMRLKQLMAAVSCFFQIPIESVYLKVRQKQSGAAQYERLGSGQVAKEEGFFDVTEGRATLEVNLERYLDTGLFLDHRPLRQRIFETAKDKRFLNLFCYTATASVQAALGGARQTVSVDLSKTYLAWAQRNFKKNQIDQNHHQLVNADCLVWIKACQEKFDIIMLDPPSFSNSKKMTDVLDVQRDHVKLILAAIQCLAPDGLLYFSTNLRTFKMDQEALSERCSLKNISSETIDEDFSRNAKIHQCWCIKKLNSV